MIPKIIHYTWFSGDPFPSLIENCIASWKMYMPEYEFRLWDYQSIKDIDNPFLREALECRKWAFAADFTRLFALFHHGGIYLDTDVEVFKSFDLLLKNKAFIGRENSYHISHKVMISHLSSHCMGAEAGHSFIKACLDYYKSRHFILSKENWLPDNLKYDQTTLPNIQMEIAKLLGYSPARKIRGIQEFGDDVKVYPYQYFDCHDRKKISYCKHWAMGSWRGRTANPFDPSAKFRFRTKLADILFRINDRAGFLMVKDHK